MSEPVEVVEDLQDVEEKEEEVDDADLGEDENVTGWDDTNEDNVTTEYHAIMTSILELSAEHGTQYRHEDAIYPADVRALWKSGMRVNRDWNKIEWKRPDEISDDPSMFRDGITTDDIVQGMVGNCWWLAACGAICRSKSRMRKVIPSGQPFVKDENYAGVFHFRFWRFGKWVDVVVDDKLPAIDGRLCFASSVNPNEFWVPLLEKAYAKLTGCYKAMEGGRPEDALEDLTGGLAVVYKLGDKTPDNLKKILAKATRNETFICAGVDGRQGNTVDANTGLVAAHAYSVLNFAKLTLLNGEVENLVKVRNPWGGQYEWKLDYCDGSEAWDQVSDADKERLNVIDADNGEWWMRFADFTSHFADVTLCTMGPDFDGDGEADTKDKWQVATLQGKWTGEEGVGGSRNDPDAYAKNPQFLVNILEPDDFDPENDEPESEGKATIVVGLMQKDRRAKMQKKLYLCINMFSLERERRAPDQRLDSIYFQYNRECASSGTYSNSREVSLTVELPPGAYMLVPSSFYAGEENDFIARVYSEKPVTCSELE